MAPSKKSTKPANPTQSTAAHESNGNDDTSENNEPVSSFQSLFAEGDILAKQGDYRKAIEAYTKALGMRLGDKNCHVARSKCYLQLGDSQAALEDADMALKEDPEYFKGVFQKAEALYAKGDFEMALVFYHRGNKLRPELDEFRLGIQKAREAIDNSIGNPRDYKFQAPQGIKFTAALSGGSSSAGTKTASHVAPSAAAKRDGSSSGKNVKQLLGELYADREYLEQLYNDRDFVNNPNDGIIEVVSDALNYLETRTEFWRQQKPIYARRKEHSKVIVKAITARNRALIAEKAKDHKAREALELAEKENPKAYGCVKSKPSKSDPIENNKFTAETLKYVNASMNVVTRSIERGDFQRALQSAKSLVTRLPDIRNIPNRDKVVSDVTSIIGSIYMDVGSLPNAMQFFRKDLSTCRSKNSPECLSRALSNMGRICVKLRRFDEAIAMFEEKLEINSQSANLPPATSTSGGGTTSVPTAIGFSHTVGGGAVGHSVTERALERAWLLHDIGRCHLEMGRDASAKEKAEASLSVAEGLKDRRWGLNALVLIGQVEVRAGTFAAARTVYAKGLAYAHELEDVRAVSAISEALSQLNTRGKSPETPPATTTSLTTELEPIPQTIKPRSPSGQQTPQPAKGKESPVQPAQLTKLPPVHSAVNSVTANTKMTPSR
ncbi:hypothetical protein BJ741DRAFT_604269 [Chytriomyces cf. hyalinus JEL632]|nr:hypothetical protein BJ741DRAFT_604269 [Chytriomyces cf. hyalinus JEL632]